WKKGLVGAAMIFIVAAFSFPSPLIHRFLIDKVILGKQMKYLLIVVLVITALKLFLKFLTAFQKFWFSRFEQEVTLDIQHTLIDHTLHFPKSFFDSKDTGYLMSRLMSDAGGLRWFFSSTIVYLISSVFRFIGGVALLFYLKWQLALVVIFVLPGMVIVVKYFAKRSKILSHHGMEQSAKVHRSVQESLSTTSLIKAFSSEKKTVNNIVGNLKKSVDIGLESSTVSSAAGILISLFPEIARFIVLLTGGYWVINGDWSLGSLFAFQSYIGYVYGPAQFMATANINLQRALASLERVSALFDIVPEENIRSGKKVKKLKGEIEFKNVTFAYGGKEEVLSDVSFKVKPGDWLAVVGPSGVGKTTLISLILNFYKPDKGELLFDNLPASEYNLKDLRRRIGYVSQNPTILSGTVMENLKYGNEKATDDVVRKAAKTAGIDEFINKLPGQYDEKLGEKGVNMSEGQRQRLSIARALVRDPDILILDEPTSALDKKIEHAIFDSLPKVLKNKTLILISHRLSTIKSASRVLFLNEKKLIASGTHDELVKKSSDYRSLTED
ncbi:MAG: ABC transporter ATP-binding protein, partial [Candidatus Aminicenantes bacterium]|nr:ABC transporter ATP-binding protein [Candidatus Aminicenantes bacterium]